MEVNYGKAGVEQEVRRLSQPSRWAKCEAEIRGVAINILKSWNVKYFAKDKYQLATEWACDPAPSFPLGHSDSDRKKETG